MNIHFIKSFSHRHILYVKTPETTRTPWAQLWRGALHFTEEEREAIDKEGISVALC